jgi:hypothetical protein
MPNFQVAERVGDYGHSSGAAFPDARILLERMLLPSRRFHRPPTSAARSKKGHSDSRLLRQG